MKFIASWIGLIFFSLLLCVQPAYALSDEWNESLPDDVQELMEESLRSGNEQSLEKGIAMLWDKGRQLFRTLLRQQTGGAVLLLCAVLLCALADDFYRAADSSVSLSMVSVVGATVITMIAAGDLHTLMGVGMEAMEALETLSKSLLPTLMAAVAASGGAVSAGVRHVAAVFFTDILISLIRNLLLPMVYIYIAAAAANAMVPGRKIGGIASAIRKGTTWLLSGALVLYTGYLSLSGTVASSADALAVQLTRSAIGVVPIVGGIISDAAGTVLNGAAILKNTVGIAGTLAVLALCLTPFLKLAIQYLLYKAAAFLAGTLGSPSLVELIHDLGSAFGLILGMTGACAVLLLISTVSAVMVVTL